MAFRDFPAFAAWRHQEARDGFEVSFFAGDRVEGHTAAVEEGQAWAVRYSIALAPGWTTRSVRLVARSAAGERTLVIEGDGAGGWLLDGAPAAHLDGLLDVDLEASAFTNALPVRRLALAVGAAAAAPAVYVRAPDLRVELLEQHYARVEDDGPRERYDYSAPRFGYADRLAYDEHGLVLDYPGLAARAA